MCSIASDATEVSQLAEIPFGGVTRGNAHKTVVPSDCTCFWRMVQRRDSRWLQRWAHSTPEQKPARSGENVFLTSGDGNSVRDRWVRKRHASKDIRNLRAHAKISVTAKLDVGQVHPLQLMMDRAA